MLPDIARSVLDFWFADALASPASAQIVTRRWFTLDPAFDRAIAARFGDLPDIAAAGGLDHWDGTPRGALAHVIVLDQFPRNLHRNGATAFAYDPHAQRVAGASIAAGFDVAVDPLEAIFFYLPLEHAEDVVLQERSVALFDALTARAGAERAQMFAGFAAYARRHRDVIARFGRFPHRNAVLERVPTAEESAWLAAGGERFGATPARSLDATSTRRC